MQSIQRRLLISLLIGLPLIWLTTISIMVVRVWHEINAINDAQITQLAQYLLNTDPTQLTIDTDHAKAQTSGTPPVPKIVHLTKLINPQQHWRVQDNAMGFAIWQSDGTLIMADDNGKNFPFIADYQGFKSPANFETMLAQWWSYVKSWPSNERKWRLFYVEDASTHNLIIVGQNLIFRREVILDALLVQLLPAFVGLMFLIGLAIWRVRQGFATLLPVIHQIEQRSAHATHPITGTIPNEIAPLVHSINQLLVKVSDTLAREQRFTADASHELRSPLTALQLQNQILQQQLLQLPLEGSAENLLFDQTQKIADGIERANHLVEQLLTLAKLEPQQALQQTHLIPIDWLNFTDNVLQEVNRHAREKYIKLKRTIKTDELSDILPLQANPIYLQIMLRNLLDNAIRYCPDHSLVELILDNHSIELIDNGKGVSNEHLALLTQRFYRPLGQSEQGSGLGLSIVKRIADLYQLSIEFTNRAPPETGFIVKLTKRTDVDRG